MGAWPHDSSIQWNDGLDAALLDLRITRGLAWAKVAAAMGFCPLTCQRRAQHLGIPPQPKPGRPSKFNAAVDADILARRARGESFAAIGAALGMNRSSAWVRYRELTRSAAPAAPEVSCEAGAGSVVSPSGRAPLPVSSPVQTGGAARNEPGAAFFAGSAD